MNPSFCLPFLAGPQWVPIDESGSIFLTQRGQIAIVNFHGDDLGKRVYDYRGRLLTKEIVKNANAVDRVGQVWHDPSTAKLAGHSFLRVDGDLEVAVNVAEIIVSPRSKAWKLDVSRELGAVATDAMDRRLHLVKFLASDERVLFSTYGATRGEKTQETMAVTAAGTRVQPSATDRSVAFVRRDLVAFIGVDDEVENSLRRTGLYDQVEESLAVYLAQPSTGKCFQIKKLKATFGGSFGLTNGRLVADPAGRNLFVLWSDGVWILPIQSGA